MARGSLIWRPARSEASPCTARMYPTYVCSTVEPVRLSAGSSNLTPVKPSRSPSPPAGITKPSASACRSPRASYLARSGARGQRAGTEHASGPLRAVPEGGAAPYPANSSVPGTSLWPSDGTDGVQPASGFSPRCAIPSRCRAACTYATRPPG
eukprot:scaffold96707_cov33-Tisochrysis_lutea.AAC.1